MTLLILVFSWKSALVFELVGDDQAPMFFEVAADTGHVTVRQNLKNDDAMTYTVRISHNLHIFSQILAFIQPNLVRVSFFLRINLFEN